MQALSHCKDTFLRRLIIMANHQSQTMKVSMHAGMTRCYISRGMTVRERESERERKREREREREREHKHVSYLA